MTLHTSNEFDALGTKIKPITICNAKWNEEFKYLGRNLAHAHISYLDWMYSRRCTASSETQLSILLDCSYHLLW